MMQQAGGDDPCSSVLKTEDAEKNDIPKALREGDHDTDVIFIVEGQNLHFSKAVLFMCSPVFRRLLTPQYLEQHPQGIPLPGKKYDAMAFFLQQIHPVYSVTPVTDDKVLEILALASEYEVAHIYTKCEQYIGIQLEFNDFKKTMATDTLLTYLTACDQFHLAKHRDQLVQLAAENTTEALQSSQSYKRAPGTSLRDVLLVRCQTLEQKIKQCEKNLLLNKQTRDRELETIKYQIQQARRFMSQDYKYLMERMIIEIDKWKTEG